MVRRRGDQAHAPGAPLPLKRCRSVSSAQTSADSSQGIDCTARRVHHVSKTQPVARDLSLLMVDASIIFVISRRRQGHQRH